VEICIALALSSTVLLKLPSPLTLAWEHSVAKTRIEEDYHRVDGALVLTEVRTRGPAPGIEPPVHARFAGGWWRYRPQLDPLPRSLFANTLQPGGYEICHEGRCTRLRDRIGGEQRLLEMAPCP
jgi:hypothetical protein